jgi:4-hydroxyphenylpyruvate dioxygenase
MKTSIATVSISGTLEHKLHAVAAAGFDAVEIFENDLINFPQSPQDIRKIAHDLGLAISLFQPFRDFEAMPEPARALAFERMKRKFDVMAQLETDLILLCSNCSPHSKNNRDKMLTDLHELGEMAATYGMRIGYEALAWGRHIHDHRDAWGLVRDVNHPHIGLILDSFHSLARNVPSASIRDIKPEKLFLIQVADAPKLDMDYLYWSRHFRCMPAQGELPIREWAQAIADIGFNGYWSLEIFNDRFREASAHSVATDGLRSLKYLGGALQPAPHTKAPLPAPSMPPRADVAAVSFIEFAVHEEESQALEAMLAALGFVKTAHHIRKSVTRWQQGAINLIVNSEPEGFAHSFDTIHGGSVCAIGLVVKNVQAVLARAKALHIPLFSQAVAENEMALASVRGVGGSLIYLIEAGEEDAVWQHEFAPLAGAEPSNALGLKQFDHIAQTMRYQEFLSWLLYYLALFDVEKTPQLEIADPLGLVMSQAVESPNKALRITLNGSLGAQTLSSRFINNYMGAGVQHIALSTDDIFAASAQAKAHGLELIAIPANYYDDLAARFPLSTDMVDKLRTANILYDQDGETIYLQFYTRAFGKRVFFEIVERRGYSAYGASNAIVRLAAQSRFIEKDML